MPLTALKAPRGMALRLDAPRPFDPGADLATLISAAQSPPMPTQDKVTDFAPTMLVSGPAAAPFKLSGTAQDKLRASLCLTAAIYYEAGNEPDEGQRAVAQVILNRVRHPAYPDTICGVVYQGTERNDTLCQFTFGCDGSMARLPVSLIWNRARRNAQAALLGDVYAPVGLATHYHTLAVNPVWSKALTPAAIIGAHIFYRWPGGAGNPKAFHATYRGNEPVPAPKPKTFSPATPMETVDMVEAVSRDVLANARSPASPGLGAGLASSQLLANDRRYVPGALPESDVREEYRNSGQWIVR
jgi:spore germination cell wall hydrolase CwlJ-like protein